MGNKKGDREEWKIKERKDRFRKRDYRKSKKENYNRLKNRDIRKKKRKEKINRNFRREINRRKEGIGMYRKN